MNITNKNRYTALNESEIRKECPPTTKDPQNKALAGVGNPMKELLCRGSILNLPKRSAEKAAMMKAVYGRYSAIGIKNAGK